MRLRAGWLILILVVAVSTVVGFIRVSRSSNFGAQAQPNASKADRVCNPSDCRIDEDRRPGNCSCRYSVIVIDLGEKGPQLTSVQDGVNFNLNGETHGKQKVSWTTSDSKDYFLSLDRNENKRVDNGLELFGNLTDQLPSTSAEPNGLLSLARQDRAELGGNGDGVIDGKDAIFNKLRLWVDSNHNGVSEPGELRTLKEAGIESIALDFKKVEQQDKYGNLIRYEADVRGEKRQSIGGAYDVVLLPAQ